MRKKKKQQCIINHLCALLYDGLRCLENKNKESALKNLSFRAFWFFPYVWSCLIVIFWVCKWHIYKTKDERFILSQRFNKKISLIERILNSSIKRSSMHQKQLTIDRLLNIFAIYRLWHVRFPWYLVRTTLLLFI